MGVYLYGFNRGTDTFPLCSRTSPLWQREIRRCSVRSMMVARSLLATKALHNGPWNKAGPLLGHFPTIRYG